MRYTRLILFFPLVLWGCKSDDSNISPVDFEGMFEQLWTDFDLTYSYFDIKGIDWDAVYAANRPSIVNGQTTSQEIIEILKEVTLSLKDLHVQFIVNNTRYSYSNSDQFATNSPENATNYLTNISFDTPSLLVGTITGTNYFYVRFRNLSNSGDFQPLESVLLSLPDKDGFILDLRSNPGGNDAIARAFVNKLTQSEAVYAHYRYRNGPEHTDFDDWIEAKIIPEDPINFTNPIIVLTNRGTVSSAEGFTLMLKALPNTVFVGDTTRGSSGNPGEYTLSNGWKYTISRWQAATPDFKLIEDQGIAPDIVIFNTDESLNDGQDLMLEKAIETLNN